MLQDLCQFPVYPPCEWEMLFRVLSDRPNLLLCLFHLFPIGFDAVVSFVHFLLLSADYLTTPCCLVFFVAVFQWIDVFVICAVVSNASTLSLLWSPLLSHLTFILPDIDFVIEASRRLVFLFVCCCFDSFFPAILLPRISFPFIFALTFSALPLCLLGMGHEPIRKFHHFDFNANQSQNSHNRNVASVATVSICMRHVCM